MNMMSPRTVAPVALLTSVARLPRPARVPTDLLVDHAAGTDRLSRQDTIADLITAALAAH